MQYYRCSFINIDLNDVKLVFQFMSCLFKILLLTICCFIYSSGDLMEFSIVFNSSIDLVSDFSPKLYLEKYKQTQMRQLLRYRNIKKYSIKNCKNN